MQLKSLETYKSAFGSYDIRSLYNEVIDEPFAYVLGRAMASYMKENYDSSKFLIGADTRVCNNTLISYFVAGMQSAGYDSIHLAGFIPRDGYVSGKELDFGVASSSVVYYIARGDFDIGVVFSASHNPKEYAGLKFLDINGVFLDTGMLYEWFAKAYEMTTDIPADVNVELKMSPLVEQKKGQLFDFLEKKYEKLDKYHQFAVDFSNGAGVSVERGFLEDVLVAKNHRIEFVNQEADGDFPNHPSDTLIDLYYDQLRQVIGSNGLEFGVMFDGDVDRLGVVTRGGRVIRGDILLAIIAKQMFEQYDVNSGLEKLVIYDVMCTRMIPEKAKALGGLSLRNRMGRKFINAVMKEKNALLGGELSGHYMYGELGGCELVLLSLYYVIKESENFSSFDAMLDAYEKYPKSPSINLEVSDKDLVLQKVFDAFAEYHPERIDGVNILADKFLVTVRKSNTEPIIRVVVEADTEELLEETKEKVMKVVEPYKIGNGGH